MRTPLLLAAILLAVSLSGCIGEGTGQPKLISEPISGGEDAVDSGSEADGADTQENQDPTNPATPEGNPPPPTPEQIDEPPEVGAEADAQEAGGEEEPKKLAEPSPPGPVTIHATCNDGVCLFSYEWNRQAERVTWFFGDGTQSSLRNVEHTYGRDGTYTVTLILRYAGEDIRPDSIQVEPGRLPLTIEHSISGNMVEFGYVWSQDATSVQWQFGDGASSTEHAPTHEYATGDDHTVTLTADGETTTLLLTFDSFPLSIHIDDEDRTLRRFSIDWGWDPDTVSWTFSNGQTAEGNPATVNFPNGGAILATAHVAVDGKEPDSATLPFLVERYPMSMIVNQATDNKFGFDYSWSLTPTSEIWMIDGVTTSAEDMAEYTFSNLGTYEVTIDVSDGLVERSDKKLIAVTNMEATFSVETFGLQADFDFTWLPDAPDSVRWEFGDGASSTAATPHYRYSAPGDYTVTVHLAKGAVTQTATRDITMELLDEPDWGDPLEKSIRPGIRTSAEGSGCTANFLFTQDYERFFLGSASHCISPDDSSTLHNNCEEMPMGHPIGTPVALEDWRDGSNAGTAKLIYHSWSAMTDAGATDDAMCVGNDFALYELDYADLDKMHPAVLHFGGPTAFGATLDSGDAVYGYGASGLRYWFDTDSAHQTNMREGTYTSLANEDWTHRVNMFPTFNQGDSGSGLMGPNGEAMGALSTISAGTAGAPNNYANLETALEYMEQVEGWAPTLVTWSDFNPDATPPMVTEALDEATTIVEETPGLLEDVVVGVFDTLIEILDQLP